MVNTAGVAYFPPNPPPFPPLPPPRGRGRGWGWVIALTGGTVLVILFVVIVVNATKSGPSSAPGAAESYAFGHDRVGPGVAEMRQQMGTVNVRMMCDAEFEEAKLEERLPDPWVYDEGMRGCKDYVAENKRTGN